jgi:hypothetical protein
LACTPRPGLSDALEAHFSGHGAVAHHVNIGSIEERENSRSDMHEREQAHDDADQQAHPGDICTRHSGQVSG